MVEKENCDSFSWWPSISVPPKCSTSVYMRKLVGVGGGGGGFG